MDISKIYLEGDQIKYLQINDEGLEYPIDIQSLHKPEILDNLLNDGWELYGLPYDLRKGDLELKDLPSEQKSWEQFDEMEKQDMMDMKVGLYQDVDLRARISKNVPVVYHQFTKSLGLIQTREEMLNFLDEWLNGKVDFSDPRYYLPLNSFVQPNALFSVEEYLSNDNAYYRHIIEARRTMDMETFEVLVDTFVNQGMSKDFTTKNLVDRYLSWGLCGINLKVREVRQEEHNFVVGSVVRAEVSHDNLPYVKRKELTYLDQDGIVHYPGDTRSMYKTDETINSLQTTASILARMSLSDENVKGHKLISPTKISSNITTRVTIWESETRVTYDERSILLEGNRQQVVMSPIRVRSNVNNKAELSMDILNYKYNENSRQRLADFLYSQAIVAHLVDIKTVKADVSTTKALSAVSVSEGAASRYLIHQDIVLEMYKDELASQRNSADLSDDIRDYLYGNTDELNQDTEALFNLLESRQINIDNIGTGMDSDARSSTTVISEAIEVAHKYLGLSYNTIYEQIRSLTGDEEKVYLKGNGMVVVIPLANRDKAVRGYYADVKEYSTRQCEEARQYHFVTRIFRALDPNEPATGSKHCAVETLTYVKHRTGPERKLYVELENYFNSYITLNVMVRDQDRAFRQIPRMIAKSVFSIYLEGKIHHLPIVGGAVVDAPKHFVDLARLSIIKRFDSLIAITEQSISNGGKFFSYIANATILPDLVIPYKGHEIPEQSLFYYWWAPQPGDPLRRTLVEKGHIPHVNWPGMSLTYEWYDLPGDGKKSADKEGRWAIYHYGFNKREVMANPVSMTAYVNHCTNWKNAHKDDPYVIPQAPSPYYWEVLKNLYSEELEEYSGTIQRGTQPSEYTFRVNPTRIVTYDTILEEHVEARNLMDPTTAYTQQLDKVVKFKGLTAEELYILGNTDKIIDATKFTRRAPIYWNNMKEVILVSDENGVSKEYSIQEIDQIDSSKYAVKNIYGRKFVFKDYKGVLYSVVK